MSDTSARDRATIAELIGEGRLDQAAFRARSLAGSGAADASLAADVDATGWLAAAVLPRDRPAPWRDAFVEASDRFPGTSAEVGLALRRFLARGLARAAHLAGLPGHLVDDEPAGGYLLRASLPEEAAASLYATIARIPSSGRAALLLGNALFRLERVEEARDAYRRAFRVAPLGLDLGAVEDAEVRALEPIAKELHLEGDPRAWLPAIGLLEDVLPFSALDPVPGGGFGPATRAYDLLIAHKGARSHGERMAIRRDLRELAPELFDALLISRKLDASPMPTGTA
ncbi:MAG TPA: hypothetical protein VN033_12110 [Vulgatibacter sp.]|nr:hypothetical protein [Vulgatibacter sp.]